MIIEPFRHRFLFVVVLTGAVLLSRFCLAADKPREFRGVISDSQCATNVHSLTNSHKEMLANGKMGKTEADCVRKCVEDMGGEYVLLTEDKRVWHLSDQATAAKYAAENVIVMGEPTRDGKRILVSSMSVATR